MSEVKDKLTAGNMLTGAKDESGAVVATNKGVPNGPKQKIKIEAKRITMNPEMMDGLAGQQAKPMQDINQIIQMLLQGMTPEELVERGVPVELVQAAMDEISKEQTQVPPEQAGLAAMAMQGGIQ